MSNIHMSQYLPELRKNTGTSVLGEIRIHSAITDKVDYEHITDAALVTSILCEIDPSYALLDEHDQLLVLRDPRDHATYIEVWGGSDGGLLYDNTELIRIR